MTERHSHHQESVEAGETEPRVTLSYREITNPEGQPRGIITTSTGDVELEGQAFTLFGLLQAAREGGTMVNIDVLASAVDLDREKTGSLLVLIQSGLDNTGTMPVIRKKSIRKEVVHLKFPKM